MKYYFTTDPHRVIHILVFGILYIVYRERTVQVIKCAVLVKCVLQWDSVYAPKQVLGDSFKIISPAIHAQNMPKNGNLSKMNKS